MSLLGFFGNLFSLNNAEQSQTTGADVNPANGLPMIDDNIDVAGNPYGTDLNDFYSSFSLQDNFDDHLDISSQNDFGSFDDHASNSSFDNCGGFDDHNNFGGSSFGGFD